MTKARGDRLHVNLCTNKMHEAKLRVTQSKIRLFNAKRSFALLTPFSFIKVEPKRSEAKRGEERKWRQKHFFKISLRFFRFWREASLRALYYITTRRSDWRSQERVSSPASLSKGGTSNIIWNGPQEHEVDQVSDSSIGRLIRRRHPAHRQAQRGFKIRQNDFRAERSDGALSRKTGRAERWSGFNFAKKLNSILAKLNWSEASLRSIFTKLNWSEASLRSIFTKFNWSEASLRSILAK